MTTYAPPEGTDRHDGAWLALSTLFAVIIGAALVVHMKLALAIVVLFLAVVVPVLVIGIRLRATVLLLVAILFLFPEMAFSESLPRVMGDEALLYITFILLMAERLVATDRGHLPAMPPPGIALSLFIPLTLLTMANGAARFGISPVRGDYFEFFKFGKYLLALYVASSVRMDPPFMRKFSWTVASGAFVTSCTAILQTFSPTVRTAFQRIYWTTDNAKLNTILETRAPGTIGNPNELALFVVAGLMFTIALLYMTRPQEHRWLLWSFILADLITILVSGSRTGLLAAAIAVVLFVLRTGKRMTSLLLAGVFALIIVGLVFFTVAQHSDQIPDFLAGVLNPILNRTDRFSVTHLVDIFARFKMWKVAWEQTQASLLLGYGPAKGAVDLLTSRTTDSEVFIMALRYGLIGLSVWVGIWYVFIRTARRASRSEDQTAALVGRVIWTILIVNLMASSVNYTFLAVRRMTLLCLLIGFAAGIVRYNRQTAAAETSPDA